MDKLMVKSKNMINIMAIYYFQENIQMEKEMEKELNTNLFYMKIVDIYIHQILNLDESKYFQEYI